MRAHNRRGGRKAVVDIETPMLAMLELGPLPANEIATALGAKTKAVTANLQRLKARGKVKCMDGDDRWSSKLWALDSNSSGFALGECWKMPIEFPPLPVPGAITTHERMAD